MSELPDVGEFAPECGLWDGMSAKPGDVRYGRVCPNKHGINTFFPDVYYCPSCGVLYLTPDR